MVQLVQKQVLQGKSCSLAISLVFLNDSAVWMLMLKKRNVSVHIYNEDDIDEMILLVRDSFSQLFPLLKKHCRKSLQKFVRIGSNIKNPLEM